MITLPVHRPRALVIDDSDDQIRFLRRALGDDEYDLVDHRCGAEALDRCVAVRPDVVLLDVELPDIDGLTICRSIKGTSETRLTPVLIMTGSAGPDVYLDALKAGADDFLAKPIVLAELRARVRSAVRMKSYIDELDDAAAAILMLGATIEARDRTTSGHCQRLEHYAACLGRRIGLDDDDVTALQRGGYLHDLGKIAIPDAVLFKPGPLTQQEFELIKTHPVVGDSVCSALRSLERVSPIVRSHHETLDGRGYPDGLRGTAVPLLAQITAIVDVYDALITDRPYRRALPVSVAFDVLHDECRAGKRDVELVDEFIELIVEEI